MDTDDLMVSPVRIAASTSSDARIPAAWTYLTWDRHCTAKSTVPVHSVNLPLILT